MPERFCQTAPVQPPCDTQRHYQRQQHQFSDREAKHRRFLGSERDAGVGTLLANKHAAGANWTWNFLKVGIVFAAVCTTAVRGRQRFPPEKSGQHDQQRSEAVTHRNYGKKIRRLQASQSSNRQAPINPLATMAAVSGSTSCQSLASMPLIVAAGCDFRSG